MIKKELLTKIFKTIQFGSIKIMTPDKDTLEFQGTEAGPSTIMHVRDWNVVDAIAFHQDLGFFETYVENLWDTDNLDNLCAFLFQNKDAFLKADIGIQDGLLFWTQSTKITFTPKQPLCEYPLKFDYNVPEEHQNKRILLLGKNNSHLLELPNITIYEHGIEYDPFDLIMIYDPFFYIKNPDIFLQKMYSLLNKEGTMLWRTFVFQENILTQGKFLSKLAFPNLWIPRENELNKKTNQYFNIKNQKEIEYPPANKKDRLLDMYSAIIKTLTKTSELDYKEFELTPKVST